MIEGMQLIYPNSIIEQCPWDTSFENRCSVNMISKNRVKNNIEKIRHDYDKKIHNNKIKLD